MFWLIFETLLNYAKLLLQYSIPKALIEIRRWLCWSAAFASSRSALNLAQFGAGCLSSICITQNLGHFWKWGVHIGWWSAVNVPRRLGRTEFQRGPAVCLSPHSISIPWFISMFPIKWWPKKWIPSGNSIISNIVTEKHHFNRLMMNDGSCSTALLSY